MSPSNPGCRRSLGSDQVYNRPVATGVNLDPAEVASLARDAQNIQFVKDTSGL